MPDEKKCPECGSAIPESGAADGLCPRCLLRAGEKKTETGGGVGKFDPPSPEKLAESFPQLEILELIGQGGMGAVYKARQPKLDRTVALKILAPQLVQDPAFAERFSREARTLAKLSHPHIVGIHDFGEADGLYYFVMEYVDGAALREVMQSGRLSAADALGLVPQLCDALQFAHEAGVVHRDIKPENILLDHAGNVKIADFGLAKLIAPDRLEGVSLTLSGTVMGTPAYMAPEQIEHPLEVDHRADIYAVGVVFYEMLTGELPLGRFDPPSSKVELDIRLDQVVLRALAKEPTRRYQRAREVTDDLNRIDMVETPPPSPAAPSGKRAVTITRPSIVSWIAAYSLLMAGLLPTLAGFASLWFLVGGRRGGFPIGPWIGFQGGTPHTGLVLMALLAPLCLGFALWHLIAGIGLLKLRNWGRFNAIFLAIIELPWVFFAPASALMLLLFPVTIISGLILFYLFRPVIARIFLLGLGPATVREEEVEAIERALV